jgi:hypothetical protein
MKNIFIISACISMTLATHAQTKVKLLLKTGIQNNALRYNTFEAFRKNYNDYNAAMLTTPLNALSNPTGYNINAGVDFVFGYMTIGKAPYSMSSHATGINGEQRNMDFSVKNWVYELGFKADRRG